MSRARSLRSPRSPLSSLRRLAAKLLPVSATRYWRRRAAQLGVRAVVNSGHAEGEIAAVTARQKAILFPRLAALLDGGERLVVDLGCGPGRFTAGLAELTGAEVVGFDVVEALLALAPPAPRVSYRRMRPGAVPLAAGAADLAWVCLVLGGIDGRPLRRTAAEIGRILRPGGLLFLVENTTPGAGSARWRFRGVADYQRLFPRFALDHLGDYDDLGERISILGGRRAR